MKPSEAFGVLIRGLGLIVTCAALLYFLSAILLLFVPHYRPDVSPAWHYLLCGVVGLVFGLYLLRGAPHVVRFAYPAERAGG